MASMIGEIRNFVSRIFPKDADQVHHGNRRLECWWEPIYNPDLQGKLERSEWCFDGTAGPSKRFFLGSDLVRATSKGILHEITSVTFVDCDFQGSFDPETIVMFDKCRFVRCDFAYSYWRDTHFRDCHFEGSSFSLASFSRCQFRDNTWEMMGFSGSKTDFDHCHITNPAELIASGHSGTRPGNKTSEHRLYQWYRLQGTKAHLARTLLGSHEFTGDDGTFYETAKVHDLCQSWSFIAKSAYNLAFPKQLGRLRALFCLLFGLAENGLLRFFGIINGWGASILKPLVSLSSLYFAFSLYYYYKIGGSWFQAAQKSFNITTLVGYSNEYNSDLGSELIISQNIHVVVSIIMYSVFFGTVISKLSRVR